MTGLDWIGLGGTIDICVVGHQVAQGRCVDMLVAYTKRAPWLDKAFRDAFKVTIVRAPLERAIAAFETSVQCGKACAICWPLIGPSVLVCGVSHVF